MANPSRSRLQASGASALDPGTDEESTRKRTADGVSSGGATLKQAKAARDALPQAGRSGAANNCGSLRSYHAYLSKLA
jgi:hypothetical protein